MIEALIARLAPEALTVVEKLIEAIVNHEDPKRAAERAAAAVASEAAADEAIKRALGG